MKLHLREASGHTFDSVRSNVEKQLAAIASDGFYVDLPRAINKNKFETHYYGRYNGIPFTIMANTTHRELDSVPEDVFYTLYLGSQIIPLGAASSYRKNDLSDLLHIYLDEVNEQKAKDEEAKRQADEEARQREEQDAKMREIARQDEEERRNQEEQSELDSLSEQYRQLTGQELPSDIDSTQAEKLILQQTYLKDLPQSIKQLDDAGINSTLSISFNNPSTPDQAGYITAINQGDGKYLVSDNRPAGTLNDQVITKDQLMELLQAPISQGNSLPNLLGIHDGENNDINTKFYQ